MGILTKESRVVLEEEDGNDKTMTEGEEGDDEGVWTDGEEGTTDDLRYNGEGKKNNSMDQKHAEESFEASNHNISKVRSKRRNTIAQSKT